MTTRKEKVGPTMSRARLFCTFHTTSLLRLILSYYQAYAVEYDWRLNQSTHTAVLLLVHFSDIRFIVFTVSVIKHVGLNPFMRDSHSPGIGRCKIPINRNACGFQA